jgi:hypothetical protein
MTMLEWIVALIPILPLAAALWIGVAILFGRASGEAHERRTSQDRAGGFAARRSRRRWRWRSPGSLDNCPIRWCSDAG